jgi:hypothetical protein
MADRARGTPPQARAEREMGEQARDEQDDERATETGPPLDDEQAPARRSDTPAAQAARQQQRDLATGAENPG